MEHSLIARLTQGGDKRVRLPKHDFSRSVDGVSVRPATHDDYTAVLAIEENIFDGTDYLPALYHSYIDHPRRLCYVAEKEGEVIGFAMVFVVDDGQAVVNEGGRVKAPYRGMGVGTLLVDRAMSDVMKLYPVRRMTWVTENYEFTQRLINQEPKSKCTNKGKISMTISPADLRHIVRSRQFSDQLAVDALHVLTPGRTRHVLETVTHMQDLVPEGRWCVKYEPFAPMASNYSIITHETKPFVCTAARDGEKLRDVSFGSYYRAPMGYRYRMDLYTDRTLDDQSKAQLLASHVIKHFILIDQFNKTELVNFSPLFPCDVKTGVLKDVLFKHMKLSEEKVHYAEGSVYLVEYPVTLISAKM